MVEAFLHGFTITADALHRLASPDIKRLTLSMA